MSKKRRLEWSFFLNDRSRVTYNELCRRCRRDCKQSFRAVVIECPKYLSKRSRKGAEKKRENGAEPETAEIPLEQRAHFYTGANPVCALCEANSPDFNRPGCFASLRSEQGAAPLAPLCDYPCALPVNGQFCKDRCYLWTSPGKPVESRNLRFELLHLPLPDVMLEALKRLKSVCPILLHNIELKKFLRCYYDF